MKKIFYFIFYLLEHACEYLRVIKYKIFNSVMNHLGWQSLAYFTSFAIFLLLSFWNCRHLCLNFYLKVLNIMQYLLIKTRSWISIQSFEPLSRLFMNLNYFLLQCVQALVTTNAFVLVYDCILLTFNKCPNNVKNTMIEIIWIFIGEVIQIIE